MHSSLGVLARRLAELFTWNDRYHTLAGRGKKKVLALALDLTLGVQETTVKRWVAAREPRMYRKLFPQPRGAGTEFLQITVMEVVVTSTLVSA